MTVGAAGVPLDDLHELSAELAVGAAVLVREASEAAASVSTKSTQTDLVTQTDRDTERWLVGEILARRPHDAILGEEGGERPGTSEVRWLIDPIDGTVNYVLGIPFYAVSVAAEIDGVVVAGAVANAASGEVFHARLGGGAWLAERRLTGPRAVTLSRAVIGTGFGYAASLRARQISVVAELLPRIGDIRRIGSSSLEWCFVADGRLDAYFEAGLNPWDYAAGALIAAEAGCLVSGLRGRPPSGRLAAAAGPDLAGGLFAALEALGADDVTDSTGLST